MTSRPMIAGFLLSATSGMLSGCAAEVGDEGASKALTAQGGKVGDEGASGTQTEQVGKSQQALSMDCGSPMTQCSPCDGWTQECTTFTPAPDCKWIHVPYFPFPMPYCECVTHLSNDTVNCGYAGGGTEGGEGAACDQYGHC